MKILRVTLATFLFFIFLAAPLAARELTGTLRQIKETGKIRIGYRQSQPPMSFLDQNGRPWTRTAGRPAIPSILAS